MLRLTLLRPRSFFALGLILLLGPPGGGRAGLTVAAPDETAGDFHVQAWTTEHGLPHNTISGLAFDHAKYLWLGTLGGLSRFDGSQFKEVPIPAAHRRVGFNIRALTVENSGDLLLLPTSGEILRYSKGAFTPHPASQAIAGRMATDLYAAPDGALWIYLSGGPLLRWTGQATETFDSSAGLPAGATSASFASDRDGRIWVAAGAFAGYYAQGRLVPEPLPAGGPAVLADDGAGGIWIGTPQAVIHRRGETREVLRLGPADDNGETLENVLDVCAAGPGELWLAAGRQGLFTLQAGRLERIPLPPMHVVSVRAGPEGDIWIGTAGHGLRQLRRKNYRLFNAAAGLRENVSNTVFGDPRGGVWLANNRGGLHEVSGRTPRPVPVSFEGEIVDVSTGVFDARGNLWLGGGAGLFRQSPAFTGPVEKLPQPSRQLALLHCARNGDVWFASHAGDFGFYRDGQLRLFTAAEGYDGQSIRTLAEDAGGRLWAGTFQGDLYCFTGGRLEKSSVGDPVHDILFDDRGDQWIATASGLLHRAADGQFRKLTRAHGLADDILGRILLGDRGNLWLSSRGGFFLVNLEELRAVLAGRQDTVRSIPFGRDQGLSGLAPLHNYTPSSHKSPDGRLWFSTASGVVAINPGPSLNRPPPSIRLDAVLVNGTPADPTALLLPPGPHRLEFKFSAPSYGDTESVRIRYQLVGADPGWREALRSRETSYSGLAPGRYRFQLQAGNASGDWNPLQSDITVVVARAWWQQPWIWAVGAFLTALLAVTQGRRWSQHQLRRRLRTLEQEHNVERERVRIARDLHDDLGGRITAINLLVERLRHDAPAAHRQDLALLGERSRHLSAELHNIVWMLRPQTGAVTDFADYLRRYCERFLATPVLPVAVSCQADVNHPLSTEVQHHLFSIAKEAVNNALKHGRPSRIAVAITATTARLSLTVSDDGAGFDPAAPDAARGNGLANIRARADEIGAEVNLASAPGQGTRLTLLLPLARPV